ncbi:MAG: MBL fold metallo-hydrolase [Gemmataceae bacterium]
MNAYSRNNSTASPRVTFLGAARSVTGSMHLLEAGPHRILLDCGLHRGPREEARLRNRNFPFDPTTIDAVVLSHAHIDHCGNLPNLVRQGFSGPIYCTPATRDLIEVMLADAARVQEDDAHVGAVVGGPRAAERRPLFTRQDAGETVDRCVAVDYGQPHAINADVQLRFTDSGHLLGSAIVSLTLLHGGKERRVTFTGDLGRRGLPYLREPSAVPAGDLVICESTYGGKTHDTVEGMAAKVADVVRRTVARGGKVLVPAFSLGRTQIVVHYLRRWMADGVLPRLPLYVDSPLAAEIDQVFQGYAEYLDPDAEEVGVEFLLDADEAWYRTTHPDPCVIVASGGMCEGGKVVQHLRHHIDDPRSSLVLVSYQAPGSLGAQLLEQRPTVRFHGRTWNKWIEVAQVNGFSGHADQNDFRALLGSAVGSTGKVRLVHGEPAQSEALAATLREVGFADVGAPERGEVVAVA